MQCQCPKCTVIFPTVSAFTRHKCAADVPNLCKNGCNKPAIHHRTICVECRRVEHNAMNSKNRRNAKALAIYQRNRELMDEGKPEKAKSWYDGRPVLSAEECERLNREQAAINNRAVAKYNAQFHVAPGRVLTAEEIAAIAPNITHISKIPQFHAAQPRFE
jgi:hypothetical protein